MTRTMKNLKNIKEVKKKLYLQKYRIFAHLKIRIFSISHITICNIVQNVLIALRCKLSGDKYTYKRILIFRLYRDHYFPFKKAI